MNRLSFVAAVLAAAFLAGCAQSVSPNYDANFGEAVRQARALQTANPNASSNPDPVAGIDGQSGKAAIDRYQESFRAPPQTFGVMGIGNSIGSGSQ